MTKVIAVVNHKGGVAKTTSTVHLGVAIAEMGKKVLLVDLDSQGHIAEAFNIKPTFYVWHSSDINHPFPIGSRMGKIALLQIGWD